MLSFLILALSILVSCKGEDAVNPSSVETEISSDISGNMPSADGSAEGSGASGVLPQSSAGGVSKAVSSTASNRPEPSGILTFKASELVTNGASLDTASLIQRLFTEAGYKKGIAIAKGQAVSKVNVILDKKTYMLDSTVKIEGHADIGIDGNGSTFMVTTGYDGAPAISMSNCTNVSFENMSIDYDPLPYTQARVINVSGNTLKIKIDAGYPKEFLTSNKTVPFCAAFLNANGLVENTAEQYSLVVNSVQGDVAEILLTGALGNMGPVHNNWQIAIWTRMRAAISMSYNKDIRFEKFNLYASTGIGFADVQNDNVQYINVNITPGPKPKGATEERILSINQDGIHMESSKRGATIKNCLIEKTGDDGINNHASLGKIISIEGNKIYVAYEKSGTFGDGTVEAYNPESYESRGIAKVTAFKTETRNDLASKCKSLWSATFVTPESYNSFYVLTLDKIGGYQVSDFIYSRERCGAGLKIINSTFRNKKSKGIVAGGRDITIENCTFTNISINAISLGTGLEWGEGPFPENVVIRNCKTENVAVANNWYDETGKGSTAGNGFGAVSVAFLHTGNMKTTQLCKNITIEGCTFTESKTAAISIMNTSNVTIKGITVKNSLTGNFGKLGKNFNIDLKAPVILIASKNVTVETKGIALGGKATQYIVTDTNCSGITAK